MPKLEETRAHGEPAQREQNEIAWFELPVLKGDKTQDRAQAQAEKRQDEEYFRVKITFRSDGNDHAHRQRLLRNLQATG